MKLGLSGGDGLRAKLDEIKAKVGDGDLLRLGFLENATYPDGTPVAYIAAINEYGNPGNNQPPRPFFRQMIAAKSPGWGVRMAGVMKANGCDVAKAFNVMGEGISGQLRQSIIDLAGPALSKVTLLLHQRFPMRDGMTFADVLKARDDIAAGIEPSGAHANPLVWTGHMLASVDFDITKGEGA